MALSGSYAILTGSHVKYAAFCELRFEMLLRECHNLSGAQTSIQCYSFHVGTHDTVSQNLGSIKEDYKVLAVQVKNSGAQVIFSSILPVGGNGAGRNRDVRHINS